MTRRGAGEVDDVRPRWSEKSALRPGVALGLIAASTLLSMSVWFSASFVIPQLRVAWQLSATGASLLTIAVQVGFVIGALTSAATGVADAVRVGY